MWSVRKIKTKLKCYRTSAEKSTYRTSAEKSTFRTQNETDLASYRLSSNKKNRSYHVRNVLNRADESRQGPRFALALKYAFPHLIRNILFKCIFKIPSIRFNPRLQSQWLRTNFSTQIIPTSDSIKAKIRFGSNLARIDPDWRISSNLFR